MMATMSVPSSYSRHWSRATRLAATPQQAQLEVAYAYYKDKEPISAIAALRPIH